jgi:hypothetical protein
MRHGCAGLMQAQIPFFCDLTDGKGRCIKEAGNQSAPVALTHDLDQIA